MRRTHLPPLIQPPASSFPPQAKRNPNACAVALKKGDEKNSKNEGARSRRERTSRRMKFKRKEKEGERETERKGSPKRAIIRHKREWRGRRMHRMPGNEVEPTALLRGRTLCAGRPTSALPPSLSPSRRRRQLLRRGRIATRRFYARARRERESLDSKGGRERKEFAIFEVTRRRAFVERL